LIKVTSDGAFKIYLNEHVTTIYKIIK